MLRSSIKGKNCLSIAWGGGGEEGRGGGAQVWCASHVTSRALCSCWGGGAEGWGLLGAWTSHVVG